jgi:antitoxin VapB
MKGSGGETTLAENATLFWHVGEESGKNHGRGTNSQAIRLPREYQVDEKELYIQKIGNTIILFPKTNPWEAFENSLSEFSDDFMVDGREQGENQERQGL